MRKLLTLLMLNLLALAAFSQMPAGGGGRPVGMGQGSNIGHFYGKLVDSKTNKGIEGVTVQLLGNRFDTATKQMKEVSLATQITKANGDFSFDNLSLMGKYKLKASALNFKPVEKPLSFDIKMPQGGNGDMQQMLGMADKDLGNIKMEADATDLGNVTVTSTKPQFEMGIDRKVFNVDKNLVSTGQSATEIMKNIPSVNVDIDGNVTLRNAAPTIFIDNRPTTLTLDQIPSDIIEKVELITNPSAKYDASGGNAGIINIVLKKNKKTGYNGGIRTGIDSRGKVNLGGDLNLRQNKFNLSLSGNYNQRKSLSDGLTDRYSLTTPPSFVHNTSNSTSNGYFGFYRIGLDYFVDNRNTFSVAGNFNRGEFNSEQTQRVDSTINGSYASTSNIAQNGHFTFKNTGAQFSYKHNFEKTGHDLTADFNYNSSANDNLNSIQTNTFNPSGTPKTPLQQRTEGNGTNKQYTFQSDYENPITETTKLEAGLRTSIRDFSNLSNQFLYNSGVGDYVLVPAISNRYKFRDQVSAAYATYSFKVNKWSYQLGLRAESSNYTGTLQNSKGQDSSQFKVSYPLSLFPSAFVTYKIDDRQDFQLNYSRRVNRPNFFQLMPFPDYSDPQNINIGNAGLKPEFTNSFEVSYNNAYKPQSNFLATVFFKHTTDLITRFIDRRPSDLKPGDSAYFSTYINANASYTTGLELTNKVPVFKWWDLTVNANLFYANIDASTPATASMPAQTIKNSMFSWFAKMNSNFKIVKGLTVQLSGDYQAKTVLPPNAGGGRGGGGMFMGGPQGTAQGYNLPRYGFDLAIRKDWTWKNGQSGSLTLSVNDIFRTQVFKSYSESILFTQTSERRRDQQVFRLNFNYRFGKFDANLFKRKSNKGDQNGGGDMMGAGGGVGQ